MNLCRETNTAVVNNLVYKDKQFKTKLSFRKKDNWISEPDLLVTTREGVELIDSFSTVQYHDGMHLLSDHALLDLKIDLKKVNVSMELLIMRAGFLGATVYESPIVKVEKSLKMSQCEMERIKAFFDENVP